MRIQVGRFSPLFSIRFVDVLKTSAAESDEGSGLLLEELGAFLIGTERSSKTRARSNMDMLALKELTACVGHLLPYV